VNCAKQAKVMRAGSLDHLTIRTLFSARSILEASAGTWFVVGLTFSMQQC